MARQSLLIFFKLKNPHKISKLFRKMRIMVTSRKMLPFIVSPNDFKTVLTEGDTLVNAKIEEIQYFLII